ncbi:M81 family metallopeptidase [Demequina sp. SYSU T00039]|uniref:M81 family metallopeptidase n=1 Tax=Demequina lignilytica TaxID=3051663 RepID=A0AAW7M2V2_9MICO|nr:MULTISPECIES: M81 family metallopeptidase [unclassified Demequina]MDN4477655.1 M81 family metallopeptidase [Demequina sp. SYSU T00039-1]MDN4487994.1 M81 family metallopeptidase [Demequina sp. SYSU T00039]
MHIAIAGFGTESSTFSRHVMRAQDFTIHRGADLEGLYDLEEAAGGTEVRWTTVMRAYGGAGGPVDPDAYAAFRGEIVDGLAAAHDARPLDGIYLDLHGAAHVPGIEGAEEDLLRGIRDAVGDGPVISVSMDTHGNFSRELAALVDLGICFRHAPHIDAFAVRNRAVRKLVEVLQDGRRPLKAYVRIPLLLPGERTSTVVEPGATVFGAIEPSADRHGAVDASLWVGFAWADEARVGAAVMVTGHDEAAITACARELASSYWDARERFVLSADLHGPWDAALDHLLTSPPAPMFISDSGDNVTAGSAGDITYALERTLAREDVLASGARILFAGLTDPAAVAAAVAAGPGAWLRVAVGAGIDDRYGAPVERDWLVVRTVDGVLGEGAAGAVLRTGAIDVMVQSGRSYFVDPAVIGGMTGRRLKDHAYIPVDGYDAVVVKNGYLFPDQAAKAASWFMAITPGGTDLDMDRLAFSRVSRPMHPLDRDVRADLTPEILPTRS